MGLGEDGKNMQEEAHRIVILHIGTDLCAVRFSQRLLLQLRSTGQDLLLVLHTIS